MSAPKRVNSWVVTDDFWQRVEPLIPALQHVPGKTYLRLPGEGRPPKPARLVFEPILYVLRAGCQWKALPDEHFGSVSAVHKHFLEWEAADVFLRAAESRAGRVRPHARHRKRHLLVDGRGVPLPLVVTGANAHDVN